MQPWASHRFGLPMVAVLADAIGRICWGWGCDLDEGARRCVPRTCEVHLHRTPGLGDHLCCKLRSRFILQPLLYTAKSNLGVWLFVLAASLLVRPRVSFISSSSRPHQSEQQQQQPPGPLWRGLSLAFALHSSSSPTATRALKKEAVAAAMAWTETDGTRTTGQMHHESELLREERSTKADFRCLLILPPPWSFETQQ